MLFLAACTFQPEEIFTKISSAPTIELTDAQLKSYDLMGLPDTFALFAPITNLTYALTFKNTDSIYSSALYIDGQYYKAFDKLSGQLSLTASNYADGFHTLRLKVYTRTGTGSLADQLGAEQLLWTISWTFTINRIQPDPIYVTRIAAENGRLAVEWEPSAALTEKIVRISWGDDAGIPQQSWDHIISNPQQTQLIDSIFIDGWCRVMIINRSIDPAIQSPSTTQQKQFDKLKVVESTSDGTGKLYIKCKKSLFYNNLGYYKLLVGKNTLASTSGSNDTLFTTDQIPFWGAQTITLRGIGKSSYNQYQDTIKTYTNTTVKLGESMPILFADVTHAPRETALGFDSDYAQDKVYVVEGEQAVKTIPVTTKDNIHAGNMGITTDGEYLYYPDDGKVFRMDRNGNLVTVLDTKAVYGSKINIGHLTLGGDRYLCFDDKHLFAFQYTHNYVFDLATSQPIFDEVDPYGQYYNLSNALQVSPDGQYLALGGPSGTELYQIQDTDVTHVKTFDDPSYITNLWFDTAHGNQLIICAETQILRYDLQTGQTQTLATTENNTVAVEAYHYDVVTGLLAYNTLKYFKVFDPQDMSLVRQIPVVQDNVHPYYFYNGVIYNSKFRYDLQIQ